MVVVGIEAEIEKLRTKREMLEVDSASYSSSTVAKWRERLSFVKIQCEEAKARNQRLLDETRDVSKEFCERARVVKLSEKAFGYDVAVKEYLKKVRKLLPQWIEGVQFEAGKDQRSELARTPRSTTAKVVLDSAESRSAKFVSPALGRSFEAGHDTASPSARSLGQERSRERFSASAAFLRDEEAEDGKEMDEDPPRSTASLSPAFVPVQTASFTSMTKSIESNKKKRTPVASSVALNSPAAQDPKAESPRARERETVTAGTPKYQTPGSAVQSTPTRVRFLSQEAELAEDSVDTFDSYAKPERTPPPAYDKVRARPKRTTLSRRSHRRASGRLPSTVMPGAPLGVLERPKQATKVRQKPRPPTRMRPHLSAYPNPKGTAHARSLPRQPRSKKVLHRTRRVNRKSLWWNLPSRSDPDPLPRPLRGRKMPRRKEIMAGNPMGMLAKFPRLRTGPLIRTLRTLRPFTKAAT